MFVYEPNDDMDAPPGLTAQPDISLVEACSSKFVNLLISLALVDKQAPSYGGSQERLRELLGKAFEINHFEYGRPIDLKYLKELGVQGSRKCDPKITKLFKRIKLTPKKYIERLFKQHIAKVESDQLTNIMMGSHGGDLDSIISSRMFQADNDNKCPPKVGDFFFSTPLRRVDAETLHSIFKEIGHDLPYHILKVIGDKGNALTFEEVTEAISEGIINENPPTIISNEHPATSATSSEASSSVSNPTPSLSSSPPALPTLSSSAKTSSGSSSTSAPPNMPRVYKVATSQQNIHDYLKDADNLYYLVVVYGPQYIRTFTDPKLVLTSDGFRVMCSRNKRSRKKDRIQAHLIKDIFKENLELSPAKKEPIKYNATYSEDKKYDIMRNVLKSIVHNINRMSGPDAQVIIDYLEKRTSPLVENLLGLNEIQKSIEFLNGFAIALNRSDNEGATPDPRSTKIKFLSLIFSSRGLVPGLGDTYYSTLLWLRSFTDAVDNAIKILQKEKEREREEGEREEKEGGEGGEGGGG